MKGRVAGLRLPNSLQEMTALVRNDVRDPVLKNNKSVQVRIRK